MVTKYCREKKGDIVMMKKVVVTLLLVLALVGSATSTTALAADMDVVDAFNDALASSVPNTGNMKWIVNDRMVVPIWW